MTPIDDFDPLGPQKEAALFYGLFLRGHAPETLRADIDIQPELIGKWLTHRGYEASRENFQRVYQYRKQVLAIFNELVDLARTRNRAAQ